MEGTLGYDILRVFTAAEIAANSPNCNIPPLGTKTFDGRPGKGYRFVKATTAWSAGDIIIRDYAGADEPNSCAPCSAVSQPIAGVAASTVPINGAGWIQIEGEFLTVACAASTAGQMVGTTATVGRGTGITFAGAPTQAEGLALMAATQAIRITALDVAAANVVQAVLHS